MGLSSMNSDAFLSELMKISSDIVWKNKAKAAECESEEYAIEVEQFMTAKKGLLTFETIYEFDEEVLLKAGLDAVTADIATTDSSFIPLELRDLCTKLQIEYILNNYEEMNNYYRMLYGLPDVEDTEYIYNTKYIDLTRTDVPIHELTLVELFRLENNGYLDELKQRYSSKKYLNHLTEKKIEPYVARMAENFAILYITSSEYENMLEDFKTTYEGCRYSIMTYYTNVLRKNNTYYDSFMALCILFMTLGLMHYKYLDSDIDREFFDKDSIRYIYEAYGLPFYADIPLDYHIKIAKNINRLLSYKGSTRVFYELFDLFGFGSTDIFEYYIMKTHKFVDGKPVFAYNEDGTPDNRAMYEIKFGKVRLYDNPQLEMSDDKNQVPYNDIIASDPYWISDEDMLDKLYNGNYNYKESKYLGIQTVYDITKILYEGAFYFKMIFDNREFTDKTMIYANFVGKDVSLFNLILYACALFGKRYGYCASISDAPHTISKVLGFDFKKNLATIRNAISESDILKDDSGLLSLLKDININSLSAVNSVYKQIDDLRKYLVRKMCSTHDRTEYSAYYELYTALMYSNYIDEVYTKKNGELASSFEELLADRESSLAVRLNSDIDLDNELSNLLILLKSESQHLKYIELTVGVNIDLAITYLLRIINLLKSAKSELLGFNIVYTITARGENMMKLLCLISSIYDEQHIGNEYHLIDDTIELIHDFYSMKYSLYEQEDCITKEVDQVYLSSYLSFINDALKLLGDIITGSKSNFDIVDYISHCKSKEVLKDSILMKNKLITIYDVIVEVMVYTVKDEFEKIEDDIKNRFDYQIIRENLAEFIEKIDIENFEAFKSNMQSIFKIASQSHLEFFDANLPIMFNYYFSSSSEKRIENLIHDDIIKKAIEELNERYDWDMILKDIFLHEVNFENIKSKEEMYDMLMNESSIYTYIKEALSFKENIVIDVLNTIPLISNLVSYDKISSRKDSIYHNFILELNEIITNIESESRLESKLVLDAEFIDKLSKMVLKKVSDISFNYVITKSSSTDKTSDIIKLSHYIKIQHIFDADTSLMLLQKVLYSLSSIVSEDMIIFDEYDSTDVESYSKSKVTLEDRLTELYSVKVDE